MRVDYLLPGGGTLSKEYTVAPESRFTIYVDDEQIPAGSGQRPLASTAVAMRVTSLNGVPIIVERAMWWPQPVWYEAHNAAAPRQRGRGGPWPAARRRSANAETYVLIANTSSVPGARVSPLYSRTRVGADDAGRAAARNSRTNVAVSDRFPSRRPALQRDHWSRASAPRPCRSSSSGRCTRARAA